MPWVEHIRASTRFVLGPEATPREEASCTLNFIPGVISTLDMRKTLANDILADWRAFVQDSGARVSNAVKVTETRVYLIGENGKMQGDPAYSTGSSARGALSSGFHPWQCSLAVTLVAGESGKGRFGRIFLPPQNYIIDENGLVDASGHGTIFTAVQTLMTSLSNKPGFDNGFKLAVAGRTGAEGTLREVTSIKLGKVVDTQRRRRRSLQEAYSSVAFSG